MPRADWCRAEIYDLFDRWRRTCLIEDGSLFAPDGPPVWTEEHLDALHAAMSKAPAEGTFFEKLREQLIPQPEAVRQLGVEASFLEYLGEGDTGALRKRENLGSLEDLLPAGVRIPDDLWEILDGGIAGYGPGKAYRDYYVRFMLRLARAAKSVDPDDLNDPWAFVELVDAVGTSTDRLQANAVLHGCFPDEFDVMISSRHRDKLLQVFAHAPLVAEQDRQDQRLLAVRRLLREEMPIPIAETYDDRIRPVWDGGHDPVWEDIADEAARRIAPNGHPGGPPPPVDSALLERLQRFLGPEVELDEWESVLLQTAMRIVGLGGSARAWSDVVTALRGALLQWDLEDEEPPVPAAPSLTVPAVSPGLAHDLLVTHGWLQGIVDLLVQRRQLIFHGPPGTGKTFLARRIARQLCPDAADVRIVQFHPSYAYEDFVEGYRPRTTNGTMAYELVPGPLLQLARRAAAAPTRPHVLLIDEINRGNMAKVFGELYFLLEYRDEPLRLQYSADREFRLPPNLFVLGTMNTADRSIALIDAALRRRFSFVRLTPEAPPIEGLLARWLNRHDLSPEPAILLDTLNAMLLARDGDADLAIGPSYFMNGPGAAPDLETIWRYDLLPLIAERFHASGRDVERELGLEAVQAEAERRADAAPAT